MKKILFLCKENSARSQMAEAIVNNFYKDKFIAFSAGSKPKYVHPLAISVMKEIGIDISNQRSKSVVEFLGEKFDYVITVCAGDKNGICPVFYGDAGETIYWEIPDPARSNDIESFRRVRDLLIKKINGFIKIRD
ncbi:MAG: arsenate reductase ArsC [Candidatus Omnitrophica bacterium]|nr:arsenate reductase ArsC [Candidatus Omnitrophota bacterium]MCM8801787.1 arsenate reductase ArsC [Candidatus Omnitrophota bacterium]